MTRRLKRMSCATITAVTRCPRLTAIPVLLSFHPCLPPSLISSLLFSFPYVTFPSVDTSIGYLKARVYQGQKLYVTFKIESKRDELLIGVTPTPATVRLSSFSLFPSLSPSFPLSLYRRVR